MFRSQGLFSSLPCPSSPCTLKHCLFNHQPVSQSQSGLEANSARLSSPDECRSKKKRLIQRSATSSSYDSKTTETAQEPTPEPAVIVQAPDPAVTPTKMLEVLPNVDILRTNHGMHGYPLVKASSFGHVDNKRKYTQTFNLAAQELDSAQIATPTPIKDSTVQASINVNIRHIPLDIIYKTYKETYASLPDFLTHAARDAAEEELHIAKACPNAQAYHVAWRQLYSRLKKRSPITSVQDACTLHDLERRTLERERTALWTAPLTWAEVSRFVHSKDELSQWGYVTTQPVPQPFNANEVAACHRCTTVFTPQTRTQYPCISHWGKQIGSSSLIARPN